VEVKINPVKPGKGNFVVSVDGKEILALKGMPRPFKALRECNLEQIAKEVVSSKAK
jgi:hypothetical protein